MKASLFILMILTISVLSGSSSAQTHDLEIKKELVGVWQDSEGVGSGLTNNYQFFGNGRFHFNYNEMDGTKRVLSYSGFWNIHKGKLHLHTNRITLLIGGKWIKSTGSIATGYEIEGGRVIRKRIAPVEKSAHELSAFALEDETYMTVRIDGDKFWKLSNDPASFEY